MIRPFFRPWLLAPVVASASERLRFLLLTPFVDYAFFVPMNQGATDAARALRVEVRFTGTPDGNASALAAQAEAVLGAGYQGIGINMTDAQAFEAVAASKKGIPLISFNVDDAQTPNARLATKGQNMPGAGRQFGQAMAPLISPGRPCAAHYARSWHHRAGGTRGRCSGGAAGPQSANGRR